MGSKKAASTRKSAQTPKARAAPRAKPHARIPAPSVEPHRVRGVVESMRQLGSASYPVALQRLIELVAEPRDATMKTVGSLVRSEELCASQTMNAKARPEDVLVFFTEDAVKASDEIILSSLRTAREYRNCAFDPKELAKLAATAKGAKGAFEKALRSRIAEGSFPPGAAAVWRKDSPMVFLLEDAVGAAAPPAPKTRSADLESLSARFRRAFDELDEQTGRANYVSLHRLRRALSDVRRDDFDACLSTLRRMQQFTLDASDGRHQRLTDEERAAGIAEAGNLLVYVARR